MHSFCGTHNDKSEDFMVRKLILAFGVSVLSLGAAACNTVEGAGEDIESVANEVDEEI